MYTLVHLFFIADEKIWQYRRIRSNLSSVQGPTSGIRSPSSSHKRVSFFMAKSYTRKKRTKRKYCIECTMTILFRHLHGECPAPHRCYVSQTCGCDPKNLLVLPSFTSVQMQPPGGVAEDQIGRA